MEKIYRSIPGLKLRTVHLVFTVVMVRTSGKQINKNVGVKASLEL
jgi:hypothetical protein